MIKLQISNHSMCGELGKAYVTTHIGREAKWSTVIRLLIVSLFFFHITELKHSQDLKQRIKHVAIIILGQEM